MSRARPLPPEYQRFVSEFIIDDNATRAYLAAYPGSSYVTANSEGPRLAVKPRIKQEIQAARNARQKRTQVRADTAIREAARLAYADPLYLFEDDGKTLRNLRDIPPDTRRAIAEIKTRRERIEKRPGDAIISCPECGHEHVAPVQQVTTYDVITYKMVPKKVGLDKLWAHLGLAQEISPLDALLSALPLVLAAQVKDALAGKKPEDGNGKTDGSS